MIKSQFIKILSLSALIFSVITFGSSFSWAQQIGSVLTQTPTSQNFILSWSADSYVPPSYEGKALPTRNGHVRVVAQPIKKLSTDPDSLYYRWLLDGDVIGSAQGQGKETFTFQINKWPGDSYTVESQILDSNDTLISDKTVTIEVAEPMLLLHQENEDYSLANTLQTPTNREIIVDAIPLFFNIKKIDDLNWSWQYDGQAVSFAGQKDPSRLDLKIPAGTLSETLQKDLSVSATNQQDTSESANTDLTIEIY